MCIWHVWSWSRTCKDIKYSITLMLSGTTCTSSFTKWSNNVGKFPLVTFMIGIKFHSSYLTEYQEHGEVAIVWCTRYCGSSTYIAGTNIYDMNYFRIWQRLYWRLRKLLSTKLSSKIVHLATQCCCNHQLISAFQISFKKYEK